MHTGPTTPHLSRPYRNPLFILLRENTNSKKIFSERIRRKGAFRDTSRHWSVTPSFPEPERCPSGTRSRPSPLHASWISGGGQLDDPRQRLCLRWLLCRSRVAPSRRETTAALAVGLTQLQETNLTVPPIQRKIFKKMAQTWPKVGFFMVFKVA